MLKTKRIAPAKALPTPLKVKLSFGGTQVTRNQKKNKEAIEVKFTHIIYNSITWSTRSDTSTKNVTQVIGISKTKKNHSYTYSRCMKVRRKSIECGEALMDAWVSFLYVAQIYDLLKPARYTLFIYIIVTENRVIYTTAQVRSYLFSLSVERTVTYYLHLIKYNSGS